MSEPIRQVMKIAPQPVPLVAASALRIASDVGLSDELDCVRAADLYVGLVARDARREQRRLKRQWRRLRRDGSKRADGTPDAWRRWERGRPVLVFRPDAVDPGTGLTFAELLRQRRPAAAPPATAVKPPGWDQADDADKRRALAIDKHVRAFKAMRDEFPELNDEQRWERFLARHGEAVAADGLGVSLQTFYRYARRSDPQRDEFDGGFDGRRRRGGERADAAWSEAFKGYVMHVWLKTLRGERGTLKLAFRIAVGVASERGWAAPATNQYDSFRGWIERTGAGAKAVRAYYHGKREWERTCTESVRRDKSNFQPNEMWCGDWHRCDFLVTHNGRPVRPWLVIWWDMASGFIVSWALVLLMSRFHLLMFQYRRRL